MALPGSYTRSTFFQMFNEDNMYRGLRVQQKTPAVDADINELSDSLLREIQRLSSIIIGDKCITDDTESFAVRVGISTTSNNFSIRGTTASNIEDHCYYVGGHRVFLLSDRDYNASSDIHPRVTEVTSDTVLTDDTANWATNELVGRELCPDVANPGTTMTVLSNTATQITVASGLVAAATVGNRYRIDLTTPGGGRKDFVYMDVFPDIVDETEDTNLLHNIGSPVTPTVSALRIKIRRFIKVSEGVPMPTVVGTGAPDYTDTLGRPHFYVKLAEIDRTATPIISSGDITDTRTEFEIPPVLTPGDGLVATANTWDIVALNDSIGLTASGIKAAYPVTYEKSSLTTTVDGDQLFSGTLGLKPAAGSIPHVYIDGRRRKVANGGSLGGATITKEVYFSSDGGANAKLHGNILSTDLCYFMPSIAGFTTAAGTTEIIVDVFNTN